MEKSKNRECAFSMLITANGGVLGLIKKTSARVVDCEKQGHYATSKLKLKVSNSKKSQDIAWSKYWVLPVFVLGEDGVYRNQKIPSQPLDGSADDAKHFAFYGW